MISGVRIPIALLEVANITTDHPLSAKYENVVSTEVRYLGQHYILTCQIRRISWCQSPVCVP